MKKQIRIIYILKFLLFFLFFTCMTASLHGQFFNAIKNRVKVRVLKNIMKFIVLERHDAPVVSFNIHADVGSVDESYGITGISHFLEHLAFKGTKTVGTKNYKAEKKVLDELDFVYDQIRKEKEKTRPDSGNLKKLDGKFASLRKKAAEYVKNNEYFDLTLQQGDNGVNAYTSADATRYINSLPSNKLEFWMSLTSDRFLNPVFRDFFKERDVVMEERRLGIETRPRGRLYEDFRAAAFKAHPYHHTVIGHMSDLESITRRDVKEYFKKYYQPSNLTAAIVGDVRADEVFRMAELYFGRIPSGEKPEQVRTKEPEQWGERNISVVAQSQPLIIVGYHRPDFLHKDSNALEALAHILGRGRSSRLYQVLVKEKKAAVSCYSMDGYPGQKYPNLMAFSATPSKGKTSEECLKLIYKEIEKIKKESITDTELKKFKNAQIKYTISGLKSNANMARMLNYNDVIMGDWKKIFDYIREIEAISAEDIKRVANTYLIKKHRTVGRIIPEKEILEK